MTIDKAIEILQNDLQNNTLDDPIDLHAAEKLAIEALKEIGRHRPPTNLTIISPLPGETEEVK